jgi:hypothetical protein
MVVRKIKEMIKAMSDSRLVPAHLSPGPDGPG